LEVSVVNIMRIDSANIIKHSILIFLGSIPRPLGPKLVEKQRIEECKYPAACGGVFYFHKNQPASMDYFMTQ